MTVQEPLVTVFGETAIRDKTGLHARPAVKLTKLAKLFQSNIDVRPASRDTWTNAKSPNAVMKLRAAHGEILHLRATGTDARQAVEALVALIDRDFNG
jgi:phosphocarrier protein